MPFKKGQSGNPGGKKPGTRHRATIAALGLLEGDSRAITRVCIEKAKSGDLVACKQVLDKLIPNRRENAISLHLPQLTGVAEIPEALGAIIEAVTKGEITTGEGQALTAMLDPYRKGLELTDLEACLQALERKVTQEFTAQ